MSPPELFAPIYRLISVLSFYCPLFIHRHLHLLNFSRLLHLCFIAVIAGYLDNESPYVTQGYNETSYRNH